MKSDKGFSLVGVVVASGLLVVIVSAMLVLANHMAANMAYADANYEATNQMYLAKAILRDPDACRENFKGVKATTGTTALNKRLFNYDSTAKRLTAAEIFPQGENLKAKAGRLLLGLAKTGSPLVYELSVNFERKSGTSLVRALPLTVEADATTGEIVSCTTADADSTPANPNAALGKGCEKWTDAVAGRVADGFGPVLQNEFANAQSIINEICDKLTYPTVEFPPAPNCSSTVATGIGNVTRSGNCGVDPRAKSLHSGYHIFNLNGLENTSGEYYLGAAFSNLKSASECKKKVSVFPHGKSFIFGDPSACGASPVWSVKCENGAPLVNRSGTLQCGISG